VWRTVQADNLSHGEVGAEYELGYSNEVPGVVWLFRVVVVFGAGEAGVEEVLLLMQRAT
jgi:hypothetical protein